MPAIEKPEDLCHHHCLNNTNFENQVWHLTHGTKHKAITVKGRLSANEATALLEATMCGSGISIQPTYMVIK